MSSPLFYVQSLPSLSGALVLPDDTAKHIAQVLRMQAGEVISLTDGKGKMYEATIQEATKKKCTVQVTKLTEVSVLAKKISMAISPLKNNSRLEWFLEKATEIGVTQIILLQCERTEKQYVKLERLQTIIISAMLQSQQAWCPQLVGPIPFAQYISEPHSTASKYIAHCENSEKLPLKTAIVSEKVLEHKVVLIGPEGDFSPKEIALAIAHNYTPVSLGHNRLRTETAALVAATILNI